MVLIEESASNPPRSPFMKGGGIICLGAVRGGSLNPLCKGGLGLPAIASLLTQARRAGGFFLGRVPRDSAVMPPLWGAYLKPHPSGVDSLQKGDQGKERG